MIFSELLKADTAEGKDEMATLPLVYLALTNARN